MTVGELRAALAELSDDLPVEVWAEHCGCGGELNTVVREDDGVSLENQR